MNLTFNQREDILNWFEKLPDDKQRTILEEAEETKELSAYALYIEDLAKNGRDRIFYNSSFQHAVILVETLLKHATETVRIFTTASSQRFYLRDLVPHLKRGLVVKMLFDSEETFLQCPELIAIQKDYSHALFFKVFVAVPPRPSQFAHLWHFTVADKASYRVEIGNGNKAEASFNDDVLAEKLIHAFEFCYGDHTLSRNPV